MPYSFFHRTPAAEEILAGGFRDRRDSYMIVGLEIEGVWISDRPLGPNEGTKGSHLLLVELDLPDEELAQYEIVEANKPYREWCVPSAIANAGRVRRVSIAEEDAFQPPEVEEYSLPSPTWGEFRVFREPEGPINPPLHVPGKWYLSPQPCPNEYDVTDDDPPYWSPHDTRQGAEAAARRFEAATPPPEGYRSFRSYLGGESRTGSAAADAD
ncbi:hypothetical protein OJF2_05720 [Aquisphaera giovannonii]|uniref:Uncharacterized protein n=1 Tax=Aquisphaera giovannonii TaxID=406548 RepID=A0A5B9VUN9_9BACT|nr:hypothetical protein [Aquisphaera giovannonii]QEH32103.1 hypothetical protein OJF2_05720 [Aquisphaera giovannonii]